MSRYQLQATVENIRDFVWEIYHWDLRTPNNAKPYFFLNEINKKGLPAIYSAAVWCLFVVLLFFWLYCVTTVTPFIERSEGWSLPSVGVLDQSQKKCRFFSPKFKSAANFSAPAQEGNLFFLSGRSAGKKIHNFPIKSSHLCRTSRQVWLSCSACDHCRAYQGFQFQMQISC